MQHSRCDLAHKAVVPQNNYIGAKAMSLITKDGRRAGLVPWWKKIKRL